MNIRSMAEWKKITGGLLLLFSYVPAQAQYDPAFSQYWSLQPFYNPATTGLDGKLNVQAAYAMQLVGFENAPATLYAGVDLPVFFLSPKHGMGAGFLNDEAGLFAHKKFYIQYAYHQPLWGGSLSAGLRLGMLSEGFDGSGLDVSDTSDPAFPTSDVTGSGFDLDFGLYYKHKKWYVGASAMHLTGPEITYGDEKVNQISVPQTFYFFGGYNISFKNPLYKMYTSAMFRSDFMFYRGDVSCRLAYEGGRIQLYGGLSYSPTNSVSLLFGGKVMGVTLGYSYEMYTSAIGALNGSHEITLSYQTDLNIFKKGKNKHKSVRIL